MRGHNTGTYPFGEVMVTNSPDYFHELLAGSKVKASDLEQVISIDPSICFGRVDSVDGQLYLITFDCVNADVSSLRMYDHTDKQVSSIPGIKPRELIKLLTKLADHATA